MYLPTLNYGVDHLNIFWTRPGLPWDSINAALQIQLIANRLFVKTDMSVSEVRTGATVTYLSHKLNHRPLFVLETMEWKS